MNCAECRAKQEREWLEKVGFQIIDWSMVIPPFLEVAPWSIRGESCWKVHEQHEHDLVVFHNPPRYFVRILGKWWYMAPLEGEVLGPLTWTTTENVRTIHEKLLSLRLSLASLDMVDKKEGVFQFWGGSKISLPKREQEACLSREAVFNKKLLCLTLRGVGFPDPDLQPEESRKYSVFLGYTTDGRYFWVKGGIFQFITLEEVPEFLGSLLEPEEQKAVVPA